MTNSEIQNPIWAWVVLIGGGLFFASAFPGIFITMLVPFWKRDEISSVYIIFLTIALCILIVLIWGMKRAFQAIRGYFRLKNSYISSSTINATIQDSQNEVITKKEQPIWPWVVIAPGALALVGAGPGVLMFPIMPLFLAGMSTDSGQTPDYVPFLIIVIGYGLMIGYGVLLFFAIKRLMKKD